MTPLRSGQARMIHATKRVFMALALALAAAAPSAQAQNPYLLLGNELYQSQCATCHGELYDPGGPLGPEMGAIPAFYVGSGYLLMATPQQLRVAILIGVPGTGMNGLGGQISNEGLEALIDYVESFRRP